MYTMWVASPWGFSEMTIQPAWHECHAGCLLRAGFLAFQPLVDNTCGTRVEQVVSSFQKILRGSQLTWYINKTSNLSTWLCSRVDFTKYGILPAFRLFSPKISLWNERGPTWCIFFFIEVMMPWEMTFTGTSDLKTIHINKFQVDLALLH